MFAEVVFPLPFRNSFSYSIPNEFDGQVETGIRVVVSFGRRILTGFVIGLSETAQVEGKIKPIKDVLDTQPIFDNESLKFYKWLSDYYICSLGEALKNSVPYGLEVESKRVVVSDLISCREILNNEKNKNSLKAKLLEHFSTTETSKISFIQKKIGKKNIYSALRSLENLGAVTILNQIENAKVKIKKLKFVRLAKQLDDVYSFLPDIEHKSAKQTVILLELISMKADEYQLSELLKKTGSHQSSIKALEKKGIIEIFDKEVERIYHETYHEAPTDFLLTETQCKIIEEIKTRLEAEKFQPYLLHGVTGSGKTQIYIELTKLALNLGKTAIILVPEISLTPQITTRFYNNLGSSVTVIHSKMSLGERYDSWRGIIAGKYKVVIGPRSALFAPLRNLGLIVVDEEHDSSYKQFENVPKYNARDASIIKAKISNCPVVLGSATPSIESKFNAEKGKYKLLEVKERVDNAKLPQIKLVDITIEKKQKRMENIFSKTLLEAMADRLKKKEGIILLQNRRGFATQVYCSDCGEIEMCPDCSVSMVHHINRNILQCHYCGRTKKVPKACSNCGSFALKFWGTGTQRVEDELDYYFPNIRIERVDSDSINKKGKLGLILNRFRKGEIDIMVGTQMVSKGLDFSHVTLVGVISAETTLWLPDFRADERTFQLLTQVAGRAGRNTIPGLVLIQTQNHKHFVLQKVLQNDYEGFYRNELKLRKAGNYPPFSRIGLIEIKSDKEDFARGAIEHFYKILKKNQRNIIITPPSPAVIERVKGQYRFNILLKSMRYTDIGGKQLRNAILLSYIEFNRISRFRNASLIIDIDPQNII